jgi:hypothetical protein
MKLFSIGQERLTVVVHFPGFHQVDDLPDPRFHQIGKLLHCHFRIDIARVIPRQQASGIGPIHSVEIVK